MNEHTHVVSVGDVDDLVQLAIHARDAVQEALASLHSARQAHERAQALAESLGEDAVSRGSKEALRALDDVETAFDMEAQALEVEALEAARAAQRQFASPSEKDRARALARATCHRRGDPCDACVQDALSAVIATRSRRRVTRS